MQGVIEGELRIVVAVDLGDGQGNGAPQRHRFLLTVTRETQGEWRVSDLQQLVD